MQAEYRKTSNLPFVLLIMALFSGHSLTSFAGHLPDRLNLELLPAIASATHPRGIGFGFSMEKLNPETEAITAIQGELSFPFLSRGRYAHIDWNGSLTLLGPMRPLIFIGAKAGVAMNHPEYQVAFMALCFRVLPPKPEEKTFFKWMTKQIDLGVFANKNIYGVVRLGFSIF